MAKWVGFEIGWNITRAVIVDSETKQVTAYEDQINLNKPVHGLVDPTQSNASIWNALGLTDSDCKVAATIGLKQSGIEPMGEPRERVESIADEWGYDVNWLKTGQRLVSYVRSDYVEMVKQSFASNNITLDTLELAPVALQRILRHNYSGTLTVSSGSGWKIEMVSGSIASAVTSLDVLQERGIKVVTRGSISDLAQVRNVQVSDRLLERYQIDSADVSVAVGVSLGLATGGHGLLRARTTQTRRPKHVAVPTAEKQTDSAIPPTLDSEQRSGLIGRLFT